MPTPARIALITGASGGIGSAIARRFAAEGFRLALCGRNTEKLEAVRASLPQGTEALLLPGDVNDAGYQDACLAAVQARFGGLDVLVNCAGMAQSDAFEEITPARFDEIMTLNCRTPFFLCQKALPLLRQSQAASILNIASVTAHKGYVRQAASQLRVRAEDPDQRSWFQNNDAPYHSGISKNHRSHHHSCLSHTYRTARPIIIT